MRFSERIGKRSPKEEIQINGIDSDLRNSLWNVIDLLLLDNFRMYRYTNTAQNFSIIRKTWFDFLKEPIDEIPNQSKHLIEHLKNMFHAWNYLDVYDFIDFLASCSSQEFDNKNFINSCNKILKRELSGYRFIDKKLAPISDEASVNEIAKTLKQTGNDKLLGVNTHIKSALEKLANRKNPDYRNSIKEAISAVESICRVITDDENAELGKALKKLKENMPIHGALEQGFIKLYGYTSDEEGIRHAMLNEDNLEQEDALFMLISCSAFINYLIVKSEKVGIELN